MPNPAHPTYAGAFRCIGPDCEDPCCSDWNIPLDRGTYELYQRFPPKPLGSLVSQYVFRNGPGSPDELFAQLYRTPEGSCPFYGADRLCGIHKEYGPRALSATCSIFPRSLSRVNGIVEGSLSLSCPEAARQVLLNPDFAGVQADLFSGEFRTDNVFRLASDNEQPGKPAEAFLDYRSRILALIKDRSVPLSHRLLRVGAFCQHLANPESPSVVEVDLSALPADLGLRLAVLFRLSDSLVQDTISARFRDVFWKYIEGLGSETAGNPEDDLARFRAAEQAYHRPFFESHPYILENYLINAAFQHLLPYGIGVSAGAASSNPFNQYIQFCAQFAWVNTLLIGVSARYREHFTAEHVIETIQAFTRAFEHYPATLAEMLETLVSSNLFSLEGMAILLRS